MHVTDRFASHAGTADITIDGEVSAYRRGYIALHFDVPKKLFRYEDSNQWNNNFVRALSDADIDVIRTAVLNWPEHDIGGPADGPLHWQVTVQVGSDRETYEGNRNSDPVWRHVSALVEAVGGK